MDGSSDHDSSMGGNDLLHKIGTATDQAYDCEPERLRSNMPGTGTDAGTDTLDRDSNDENKTNKSACRTIYDGQEKMSVLERLAMEQERLEMEHGKRARFSQLFADFVTDTDRNGLCTDQVER